MTTEKRICLRAEILGFFSSGGAGRAETAN
jgi:hypothetical protein